MSEEYSMSFNHNFTSISVMSKYGVRLFSINASDKIDEIFENTQQIRIFERLSNSSLVVMVTQQHPSCIKMIDFKKKQDICNYNHGQEILCVRLNRYRLVICSAEATYIHDIRDMKLLHSIDNIVPNEYGLCCLSLNSYLAFPISSSNGVVRIFNAKKIKTGLRIKAHDTALSAINFSPNGTMLATASVRGTVIRLFCVKNGQRVQEFRRGLKRCVRIASLVFSATEDFLCASSNTETVHIFKINTAAVEAVSNIVFEDVKKIDLAPTTPTTTADAGGNVVASSTNTSETPSENTSNNQLPACATDNNSWSMSGYLSQAVSSYLIPLKIGDVLSQDRAFATAVLGQPGIKHICGLARIQKELRLLIACEDGFLYVYHFNSKKGGPCKLLHVHDLRYTLEGVIELNLSDSMDKISLSGILPSTPTRNPTCGLKVKPNSIYISADDGALSSPSAHSESSSTSSVSIIIENTESSSGNSYAGVLKGSNQMVNASLTADSAKFRRISDAIDTPDKLYDERQFPPVSKATKV